MNPNLIEVAPGMRAPNKKQKEAIPDIEPWLYLVSSIELFSYFIMSMDGY
jgi:U4/U6 small nuclear ribonucleoprotein PRP3